MLDSITGTLVAVEGGSALVECGPVVLEVLVPAGDLPRLARDEGRSVRFFVRVHLEAQGQGTSLVPRMLGFTTVEDRAFFELFTTVRGLGPRKALRALALPRGEIARAIVERDVALLKTLPEIGKRTAEQLVTTLADRVDRFVEVKPDRPAPGAAANGTGTAADPDALPAHARDALVVLVQLGEPRTEAARLIELALAADPSIDSAETVLEAALRQRS